ncbi:MAG: CvpA family protein [Chthoniobacterales bacterium]|nr:CvpA family protein [Chthoniobacterales bacterium]
MVAGSSLWQTIFVSFALVLVAFEIVRGWRLGLVRQLVRVCAVLAAYAVGYYGGPIAVPILRPFVHIPDLVLSVVGGSILALVVYAAICGIGAILFKNTGQQNAGAIRLLYGISGAGLGILFGLFSVWLIVIGIRAVGSLANAEVHQAAPIPTSAHASVVVHRLPVPTPVPPPPLVTSLAKMKNSLELGSLGEVVKGVDVVPATTYQALGKLGAVVSDPRSAQRFLDYPGAQSLTRNPKIVALRDDPEIIDLIRHQHYLELLQNKKLIEAMNDPALASEVQSFEFQKALDYALGK